MEPHSPMPHPDVLYELMKNTGRDRRTIRRFFEGAPMHSSTRLHIRGELEKIQRRDARRSRGAAQSSPQPEPT